MIGRDELLSIPPLAREVEQEAERINSMRARLTSPKGFDSRERVQTSGSQDNALVDVIIDLSQQLEDKQGMLDLLEREARQAIDRAGLTGEDRALMVLRYVEAYTWEDVEQTMHYSRATVFRRHKEAMTKLYGAEYTPE